MRYVINKQFLNSLTLTFTFLIPFQTSSKSINTEIQDGTISKDSTQHDGCTLYLDELAEGLSGTNRLETIFQFREEPDSSSEQSNFDVSENLMTVKTNPNIHHVAQRKNLPENIPKVPARRLSFTEAEDQPVRIKLEIYEEAEKSVSVKKVPCPRVKVEINKKNSMNSSGTSESTCSTDTVVYNSKNKKQTSSSISNCPQNLPMTEIFLDANQNERDSESCIFRELMNEFQFTNSDEDDEDEPVLEAALIVSESDSENEIVPFLPKREKSRRTPKKSAVPLRGRRRSSRLNQN